MSDASLLDRWARHDLGLRVVVTGMVLIALALLVAAVSGEPHEEEVADRGVATTTSRPVPPTVPPTAPSTAPPTAPPSPTGNGLTVRTDDLTAATCAAGTYAVVAAPAGLDEARRLVAEAVELTGRGAYLVSDALCGEPETAGEETATVVVGPFDSRAIACEVFWTLWGPLDAPNATFWRIDDLAAPVGSSAFPCPFDLAEQGQTTTTLDDLDPAPGEP